MGKRKTVAIFATEKSQENPVTEISTIGFNNPSFVPDVIDDSGSIQSSSSSGVSSIDNVEITQEEFNTNIEQNYKSVKHQSNKRVEMKKSINLLHCVAIMVAVTGHSSIFISPGVILKTAGSVGASFIVWFVGGFINMGLSLCFAELGTMLPAAGGPYAYVMNTFGPLPGFLILWGNIVLISGPMWAFLSHTAALYIIKPVFTDCQEPESAVKILAGFIMVSMVAMNCVYMNFVTRVQTFLSSTKLLALLIIIVGGIIKVTQGDTENFRNPFEGTSEEPGQIALAIFYSIFSYGGWQIMTSLMEEVKQPGRDLPRACYITFIIVIAKYILANAAYFTLLMPSETVASEAVALLFTQRLYKPITALISVFVALTSIGALNGLIMGHSRLLFAGSRVGHMPTILGMIHLKYLTPWPAIVVLLFWGLVMLYTGEVGDMMEFISLFSVIMGIAVIMSLFYLRLKEPNKHRPYKTMTFVPVVQLLLNIALLILAIYQKPHKMGIGLAILFAGIPIYWFGVLWNPKPKPFRDLIEGLTIMAQQAFIIGKTT